MVQIRGGGGGGGGRQSRVLAATTAGRHSTTVNAPRTTRRPLPKGRHSGGQAGPVTVASEGGGGRRRSLWHSSTAVPPPPPPLEISPLLNNSAEKRKPYYGFSCTGGAGGGATPRVWTPTSRPPPLPRTTNRIGGRAVVCGQTCREPREGVVHGGRGGGGDSSGVDAPPPSRTTKPNHQGLVPNPPYKPLARGPLGGGGGGGAWKGGFWGGATGGGYGRVSWGGGIAGVPGPVDPPPLSPLCDGFSCTGKGGATPRVWTPTPPLNRWPEDPWGGGSRWGDFGGRGTAGVLGPAESPPPPCSPGLRLSQSPLHARSATAVICGITVAPDSSDP